MTEQEENMCEKLVKQGFNVEAQLVGNSQLVVVLKHNEEDELKDLLKNEFTAPKMTLLRILQAHQKEFLSGILNHIARILTVDQKRIVVVYSNSCQTRNITWDSLEEETTSNSHEECFVLGAKSVVFEIEDTPMMTHGDHMFFDAGRAEMKSYAIEKTYNPK